MVFWILTEAGTGTIPAALDVYRRLQLIKEPPKITIINKVNIPNNILINNSILGDWYKR